MNEKKLLSKHTKDEYLQHGGPHGIVLGLYQFFKNRFQKLCLAESDKDAVQCVVRIFGKDKAVDLGC